MADLYEQYSKYVIHINKIRIKEKQKLYLHQHIWLTMIWLKRKMKVTPVGRSQGGNNKKGEEEENVPHPEMWRTLWNREWTAEENVGSCKTLVGGSDIDSEGEMGRKKGTDRQGGGEGGFRYKHFETYGKS